MVSSMDWTLSHQLPILLVMVTSCCLSSTRGCTHVSITHCSTCTPQADQRLIMHKHVSKMYPYQYGKALINMVKFGIARYYHDGERYLVNSALH